MKPGKLLYLSTIAVCTSILIINGCKKATQDTPTTTTSTTNTTPADIQVAVDNAQGEYIFNSINNIVDDAARSQGGVNKMNASVCYTITNTSSPTGPFPKTLSMYFDGTCIETDKSVQKGTLNVTFTDKRNVVGSIMKIEHSGFKVNNTIVNGTTTVTTDGTQFSNTTQQYFPVSWTTKTQGTLILNGVTSTWSRNKSRNWISGYDTPDQINDDIYSYYGSSSGTGFDSTNVDAATCLETSLTCPYVLNGIVSIIKKDGKKITIDYGSGKQNQPCDSLATVSINGGAAIPIILK